MKIIILAFLMLFVVPLIGTAIIAFFALKKRNTKVKIRTALSIFYPVFFVNACFWASMCIPQPGGIDLGNRILSPLLGPWSRFLKPNALIIEKCTPEYLLFAIILSLLMIIFVPLTFAAKNKILKNVSAVIGLCSISAWVLYGFYRILLDSM